MSFIRVLGIGSPFGYDQIAWWVIDYLLQKKFIQNFLKKRLYLEKCDRPGIHLLNLMQNSDRVFLIDAIKMNLPSGAIKRITKQQILQVTKNHLSTHDIGLATTLKLGHQLNLLPKYIVIYGIEIGNLVFNDSLDELIRKSAILVSEMIVNELRIYLN